MPGSSPAPATGEARVPNLCLTAALQQPPRAEVEKQMCYILNSQFQKAPKPRGESWSLFLKAGGCTGTCAPQSMQARGQPHPVGSSGQRQALVTEARTSKVTELNVNSPYR